MHMHVRLQPAVETTKARRGEEATEANIDACVVANVHATRGLRIDSIVARGKYSEADAAAMTRSIVQVVAHCHSLGVIHRWEKGGEGQGVARARRLAPLPRTHAHARPPFSSPATSNPKTFSCPPRTRPPP